MTYHVCNKCDNVWWGGCSDRTDHDGCYKCREKEEADDGE